MGGLFTVAAIIGPMCLVCMAVEFLYSLPEKRRQKKAVAYLRTRRMRSDW